MEPIETDRTLVLGVPTDRLWEVLDDVPAYPSFWPWLTDFDGRTLAPGEVWRGVVRAGLPLQLVVAVRLEEVDPGRSVTARIEGELSGSARLTLAPADAGTALHLIAALRPESGPLRALTHLARPLAQASHDRVITRALAQLRSHVEPPP